MRMYAITLSLLADVFCTASSGRCSSRGVGGSSPIFTAVKSGRFIEDVGVTGSHPLCREHDPDGCACRRIVLIQSGIFVDLVVLRS